MDRSVELRWPKAPTAVPVSRIYFAFPDGRLDYDCVGCGSTCCRGFDYGVTGSRELLVQLELSRTAHVFLERKETKGGVQLKMRNCAPGCFFLQEDGKCRVHVSRGYAEKPETCRLFPFNSIRQVDDWLIVAPHPGLCPLVVTRDGGLSARSSHDAITASLVAYGIAAQVPIVHSTYLPVEVAIRHEQEVTQLAERRLADATYQDFATDQVRRAMELVGIEDHHKAIELSGSFVTALHEALGVAPSVESCRHSPSVSALIALTPAIRAQLVFRGSDGSTTDTATALLRVPRVLIALSVLVALARESGMTTVGTKTVQQLFAINRSLLEFLSYVDSVVAWRDDVLIELAFSADSDLQRRYMLIAHALLPQVQRQARATLGQVLAATLPKEHVARVTLLRMLAERLAKQIVPVEQATLRGVAQSPRRMLQRIALRYSPLEALARRQIAAEARH